MDEARLVQIARGYMLLDLFESLYQPIFNSHVGNQFMITDGLGKGDGIVATPRRSGKNNP